ncbi:MAG TPA: hypothetical protein VM076_14580 [Gemmatimonadaceae bacterium]|nr:hypothetical protein [Gemmatimonadaceae bacterium]
MITRGPRALVYATMSLVTAAALAASTRSLVAQRPAQPPSRTQQRRPETIEIRGQVPTPQVVTVRPREAPEYSRRVLVPAFFDHDFWPSILPPLQIVSPGSPVRYDSTGRATGDSASRVRPGTSRPPSGTSPASLRR